MIYIIKQVIVKKKSTHPIQAACQKQVRDYDKAGNHRGREENYTKNTKKTKFRLLK